MTATKKKVKWVAMHAHTNYAAGLIVEDWDGRRCYSTCPAGSSIDMSMGIDMPVEGVVGSGATGYCNSCGRRVSVERK